VSPGTLVIRPPQRGIHLELRNVWEHRGLVYFFVWRDIKVRYKQSVFGVGWAILQPLLMMAAFTLFFGKVAAISTDGIPRPIFYYAAILPWGYFSTAVTQASSSVLASTALLTKVYFPRLVLPLASVLSGLLDLAIAFVMLAGMVAYHVVRGAPGVDVSPSIVLLPFFVILAVGTALGTGLWLAALHARYRDVRYIVGFLTQFWMFASPVVYPSSIVPERWRTLYRLNPMAVVIDGFRWTLTGRGQPSGQVVAMSTAAVLLLLWGGLWYFRKREGTMADIV
jgi:lipopolysaccharide transport system permease protein